MQLMDWCVHHKIDGEVIARFLYAVDAVEWAATQGAGTTVRRDGVMLWTAGGQAMGTVEAIAVASELRDRARELDAQSHVMRRMTGSHVMRRMTGQSERV
jgi:hypothetical protein